MKLPDRELQGILLWMVVDLYSCLLNVIPAQAGIQGHDPRLGEAALMKMAKREHLQSRHWCFQWIPACAGMTDLRCGNENTNMGE